MRMAALLLALARAALAAPEVELPLGSYARAGVPVLARSASGMEVICEGWRFAVGPASWIAAPRVPCRLEWEGGTRDLLAVPGGALLVGLAGDAPPDLESRLRGAGGAPVAVASGVRLDTLRAQDWRALDLFDRLIVVCGTPPPAPAQRALLDWVAAGGDLVAVGWAPGHAGGLGRSVAAAGLEGALREAGEVRPLLAGRPGAVRPDLYDLVAGPGGPVPALRAARWIVLAGLACVVLQVLLAGLGLVPARAAVAGVLGVSLLAAAVGVVRTRADYTPVARGRIEVTLEGAARARVRVYDVLLGIGPGASFRVPLDAVPILYADGSPPWWQATGGTCALTPGVIRVFSREHVAPASRPGEVVAEAGRPLPEPLLTARPALRLLAWAAPGEAPWSAAASIGLGAPEADPAGVPLLARLQVVAQR